MSETGWHACRMDDVIGRRGEPEGFMPRLACLPSSDETRRYETRGRDEAQERDAPRPTIIRHGERDEMRR